MLLSAALCVIALCAVAQLVCNIVFLRRAPAPPVVVRVPVDPVVRLVQPEPTDHGPAIREALAEAAREHHIHARPHQFHGDQVRTAIAQRVVRDLHEQEIAVTEQDVLKEMS